MNDFVFRKIWIAIDANGDAESVTLGGAAPMAYKNGEVMFCLALCNKLPQSVAQPGEFLNHSLLQSFLIRGRSGGYAQSNPLILDSSSGADVEIDATVTEEQFITKVKAPIQIYFPTTMMGLTEATHYLAFIGATTDKPVQPDGFGRARLNVVDIGIADSTQLAITTPGAASVDMVNAAIQSCVKYGKNPAGKSFSLTSANGTKGRLKYTSDDGEDASELITY